MAYDEIFANQLALLLLRQVARRKRGVPLQGDWRLSGKLQLPYRLTGAQQRVIGEIRGESISVRDARIRATRHERIMIVEVSMRRAIDFSKSSDPMRYTNHSCAPNARLTIRAGRVEFYSLRAIVPDEEITVSYGETHHEGRLACRCGAANCVGRL